MKKPLLILTFLLSFFVLFSTVKAKNENSGQNTSNSQQVQQQLQISTTPTGNQIQNQNQIKTQNQGEDSQLQVNTQEQENLGEKIGTASPNRSQNAIENMSEVAKQVQQLLQAGTTGGLGDQVRQIAQEQNQAQAQIQEQLNKLESKNKLVKFLTGTDYGAIKNLKQQLEQNQLRIEQLTQLQNQLSNLGDVTIIQETIKALVQENISLQERIASEEQTRSLFGWLFKIFKN